MEQNPYAAPTPQDELSAATDSADLFVETLPKPPLRAAMISLGATALLLVFTIIQIVGIATFGTTGTIYLVVLAVLAALYASLVWAVRRGSLIAAVIVFALAPLTLMAAAFMLLSIISLLPLAVMGLATLDAVLVGLSWTNIRRIGLARAAIKKQAL